MRKYSSVPPPAWSCFCTRKNFIKGRKWNITKLEPNLYVFTWKPWLYSCAGLASVFFIRVSERKTYVACLFAFNIILFIFIGNTSCHNSLKMKSVIVCGESNIACTSELNLLAWIVLILQEIKKQQQKVSFDKCWGCTGRRRENYREVLVHNSNFDFNFEILLL